VLIFLIFYLVRFTTTQGRTPTLIRVDFRWRCSLLLFVESGDIPPFSFFLERTVQQ
jgi:hypothetical protein